MKQNDIFDLVGVPILGIFPCGSRITCSPPILDTDEDWIIRVDDFSIKKVDDHLVEQGFRLGGSILHNLTPESQKFWSYTKQGLNHLIVYDIEFFNKFNLATKVCKRLNLRKKVDRICLFQAILYRIVLY